MHVEKHEPLAGDGGVAAGDHKSMRQKKMGRDERVAPSERATSALAAQWMGMDLR